MIVSNVPKTAGRVLLGKYWLHYRILSTDSKCGRITLNCIAQTHTIHEEKTKEIATVMEVWICHPNCHNIWLNFALIFSKNYQCL